MATRDAADEDALLAWLERQMARSRPAGEPSPIGDDAALLPANGPWAVTTDTQIAGTHFPPGLDPAIVARRLLAVNLSDLAAMGARPRHAFLVISAPSGFDHRRFFTAFLAACEPHGLQLQGGDLSRQQNLTLVLTLLGDPTPPAASGESTWHRSQTPGESTWHPSPQTPGESTWHPSPQSPGESTWHHSAGHRWLERSGARIGHRLWVGGTLGESAAGYELVHRGARPTPGTKPDDPGSITWPPDFEPSPGLVDSARRACWRHLEPRPQLALGAWLANHTHEGGCMDISDGLARDLHRLCRASKVGAELEADALPLPHRFPDLCHLLGLEPLELVLGGGEDYVLLFTLPPNENPPAQLGARVIGRVIEAPEADEKRVVLAKGDRRRPLPPSGWDHLRDEAG